METPRCINLSDIQPPKMFEIPSAKKGIQNKSPIRSNDIPRYSLRYLGTQNIKKIKTGSSKNRILTKTHKYLFFKMLAKETLGDTIFSLCVPIYLFQGIRNQPTTQIIPTIAGIIKLALQPKLEAT